MAGNRVHIYRKELRYINREEEKLLRKSLKEDTPLWRKKLEAYIPEKVYTGLETAFIKAFETVFNHGDKIIEKTYDSEKISRDFRLQKYSLNTRVEQSDIVAMRNKVNSKAFGDMVVTTIEGMGLGALGVGLPDIVVFIAFILRGAYETALSYGYSYDSYVERLFILKMIEAALTKGEARQKVDMEVDNLIKYMTGINNSLKPAITIDEQIKNTAKTCAVDMLVMKFIQGMAIVGVVGGLANPVFYNKILKYIQLKYQKRFLLSEIAGLRISE